MLYVLRMGMTCDECRNESADSRLSALKESFFFMFLTDPSELACISCKPFLASRSLHLKIKSKYLFDIQHIFQLPKNGSMELSAHTQVFHRYSKHAHAHSTKIESQRIQCCDSDVLLWQAIPHANATQHLYPK